MKGSDLKKALRLRHHVVRGGAPLTVEVAGQTLREICALMDWEADAMIRKLEVKARAAAAPLVQEEHGRQCGCSQGERCAVHKRIRAEVESEQLRVAYQDFFAHGLRDRLSQARWAFIREHPGDPAAKEILNLIYSWQGQRRRRPAKEPAASFELAEFLLDDDAYLEGERDESLRR